MMRWSTPPASTARHRPPATPRASTRAARSCWPRAAATRSSAPDLARLTGGEAGAFGEVHRHPHRLAAGVVEAFEPGGQPHRNTGRRGGRQERSEEHTSELQSLMRISYAVFCLKKKNKKQNNK